MRPIRLIVTAALTALITPLAVPAAAGADPITGVTCVASTFTARFNPGLTLLTPQTVTITTEVRLVNCLSLPQPTITSGTIDDQNVFNDFSCLSLLLPLSLGTVTIQWSNGQTSGVSLTMQVVGAAVIAFGPVVSGVFAGKQFTSVLASLPLTTPVECLTPQGATQLTGVIQADVT
jgi:hypothetical protein